VRADRRKCMHVVTGLPGQNHTLGVQHHAAALRDVRDLGQRGRCSGCAARLLVAARCAGSRRWPHGCVPSCTCCGGHHRNAGAGQQSTPRCLRCRRLSWIHPRDGPIRRLLLVLSELLRRTLPVRRRLWRLVPRRRAGWRRLTLSRWWRCLPLRGRRPLPLPDWRPLPLPTRRWCLPLPRRRALPLCPRRLPLPLPGRCCR